MGRGTILALRLIQYYRMEKERSSKSDMRGKTSQCMAHFITIHMCVRPHRTYSIWCLHWNAMGRHDADGEILSDLFRYNPIPGCRRAYLEEVGFEVVEAQIMKWKRSKRMRNAGGRILVDATFSIRPEVSEFRHLQPRFLRPLVGSTCCRNAKHYPHDPLLAPL